MRRYLQLLSLALFASCQYNAFSAERTETFALPAEGITKLVCDTHNGGVTVRGAEISEVRGEVKLVARGQSQAEADERILLMQLAPQRSGDELHLAWEWSEGGGSGWSGDASYVVEVPLALAAQLSVHNGAITAEGLSGASSFSTHNGSILVSGDFPALRCETHNGSITANVKGAGPLNASFETHNGKVDLVMTERSADVVVDTHNGSISCEHATSLRSSARSHVNATYGKGEGSVTVGTHNGSVTVR